MSLSIVCELEKNTVVTDEYFILQFTWKKPVPRAGQFFMIKPLRGSVLLPRPIGVFEYIHKTNTVKFLIQKKGRGTEELFCAQVGEKIQLTGPFGNSWADFLPENGKAALVGGSAGVAPLAALVSEKPDYYFHFFAGFRKGFKEKEQENAIMGHAVNSKRFSISAEDGGNALIGKITDFLFSPQDFDVIFGCGPTPMLSVLKKKCEEKNVPCFISMENKFACGTGACMGCTITTTSGNRRCCMEGPIFSSREVIFNE
jgi:dihydroorotate dehydrogenase electron transfer subunit